ncbi:MAG: hypothetical protein HZC14_01620 [Candidatus Niyogibacteria bacterium]|nr:hypothetical protein [Candidatus Niyogibacteria bacterium]
MKKTILYILGIVILLSGVGYLVWRQFQERPLDVPREGLSHGETAVLPDKVVDKKGTAAKPENTNTLADILAKPLSDVEPILSRAIPAGADVNMASEIKKLVELIRGNYDFRDGWINLGIYREQIKDYEGAAEAWEYASAIRPFDPAPLINLGNLYGYYVHDNKKAEEYFLKAIEAKPKEAYAYYRAHEFYADISETAKAKAVLERGIAADPVGSGDLKAALSALK